MSSRGDEPAAGRTKLIDPGSVAATGITRRKLQDNAMQVVLEACCLAQCAWCREGWPLNKQGYHIMPKGGLAICNAYAMRNADLTPAAIRAKQEAGDADEG